MCGLIPLSSFCFIFLCHHRISLTQHLSPCATQFDHYHLIIFMVWLCVHIVFISMQISKVWNEVVDNVFKSQIIEGKMCCWLKKLF